MWTQERTKDQKQMEVDCLHAYQKDLMEREDFMCAARKELQKRIDVLLLQIAREQ